MAIDKPMFSEEEKKKSHEETMRMAKEQLDEAESDVKESQAKRSYFNPGYSESYKKEKAENLKKAKADYDLLSRYKEHR